MNMSEEIDPRQEAVEKYSRDEYGLLKGVDYVFLPDGSIDWRAMVKPEFLYVNKEWFFLRGKEIPKSIEGLTDKQLLILLGGIKDLARLRGYSRVSYDLNGDKDYVVARCRIDWIPNYITGMQKISFEDFANASIDNTDKFCHKFLETIACNRAFVRCVRNFLNINIVGDDEIDKSDKSLSVDSSENGHDLSVLKPHGTLEKAANEKNLTSYEAFVSWLREQWKSDTYKNEDAKNWTQYSDIPAKECRKLLTLLSKS
jgi:hypothetical protein